MGSGSRREFLRLGVGLAMGPVLGVPAGLPQPFSLAVRAPLGARAALDAQPSEGMRGGEGEHASMGGQATEGAQASAPAQAPESAQGLEDSQGSEGAEDSLAGRGAVGTLRDPAAAGRPVAPSNSGEDAAEIQAIETRLACNCGCTLDVFTCRTTDFSCTYSPRLHREVLALRSQGLTAQQVLDAFVARYGEKALMAPKASGFNLAGYLVPGVAIATAGAALVMLIGRRRRVVATAESGAPTPPAVDASPDELERLRRALAEVED